MISELSNAINILQQLRRKHYSLDYRVVEEKLDRAIEILKQYEELEQEDMIKDRMWSDEKFEFLQQWAISQAKRQLENLAK